MKTKEEINARMKEIQEESNNIVANIDDNNKDSYVNAAKSMFPLIEEMDYLRHKLKNLENDNTTKD